MQVIIPTTKQSGEPIRAVQWSTQWKCLGLFIIRRCMETMLNDMKTVAFLPEMLIKSLRPFRDVKSSRVDPWVAVANRSNGTINRGSDS